MLPHIPTEIKFTGNNILIMIAVKVILFFWAFYFTLIFVTNSIDLLKHFRLIPKWWKFTSGNYTFMQKVTSAYKLTANTLIPGFVLIILIELTSAFYFWKVILLSTGINPDLVYIPFSIGLAMFGGFVLLDEVFLSFLAEENHFRIFNALLLSLIFISIRDMLSLL